MDYEILVKELSDRLKLDIEIFSVDTTSEKIERVEADLIIYEKHGINHGLISEFFYKEKPIKSWKAITLIIHTALTKKVVSILNEILEESEEELVELNQDNYSFEYADKGFIFLYGKISNEQLILDIATRE